MKPVLSIFKITGTFILILMVTLNLVYQEERILSHQRGGSFQRFLLVGHPLSCLLPWSQSVDVRDKPKAHNTHSLNVTVTPLIFILV